MKVPKLLFVLIVGILFTLVLPSSNAHAINEPIASYKASTTLTITSFSPAWGSTDKLKTVYEELLRNKHGKELNLLSSIVIYDGYPNGAGEAGEYHFSTLTDLTGHVRMEPGRIDIYGGHDRTTIESIARTLAHEYGHHVTHYYTLASDGFALTDEARWKQTTFARLRGLDSDPRVGLADKAHRWQVPEIAAEDYVQLFGSPNAKIPTRFAARLEEAAAGKNLGTISWNGMMYNVAPQENFDLPLAAQVPGEYDWLNREIEGKNTGQSAGAFTPPKTPELKVKQIVSEGKAGYQLTFSWQSSDTASAKLQYTLVSWRDGDELPEPIVTRDSGEPLEVQYGSLVIQKPLETIMVRDPNAVGVHHFKVYAIDQSGWAVSSNVITLNMDNPTKVTSEEVVVHPSSAPVVAHPVIDTQTTLQVQFFQSVQFLVQVLTSMVNWLQHFL